MIKSFHDRETEKIFRRVWSKRLPHDIQQTALQKLRMLNRSRNLRDLRVPPANRLENFLEVGQAHTGFGSTIKGISVSRGVKEMHSTSKSLTIMKDNNQMTADRLKPVHPGEVLPEEFLQPLGLSQNGLALDIRVPARRINEIVHGKSRMTLDTALRLARFIDMSAEFWLGMQMDYDLDVAEDEPAERILCEVQVYSSA